MRGRILVAVAVLSIAVSIHAQRRGAVDWIFLVDTSKSMRGVGGTKDIFGDVKDSIATFVREANEGDSVSIFTFDRGARMHSSTPIPGAAARNDLYAIIDGLEAEGNRTHLGLAIANGLDRAEALRSTRRDPTRTQAVVLFTDGREDVRGIADPVTIDSSLRRVGNSFVFFVSMGDHEPQLDVFAEQTERASVLRAPSSDAIQRVAEEIRTRLPKRAPKPVIKLSPAILRFGEVTAGHTSEERELTISTDRETIVSLKFSTLTGVTVAPVGKIAVTPSTPAKVKLRLDVAEDAPPGAGRISIVAAGAISAATVDVVPPSLLARIAKWLVAIALLGFIAFFLLANRRRRNRLEGEIEILQPRLPPDAASIGLPRLEANEIALSSIVPLDALAGSDARLFVRRTNGAKKVWISAQNGSLRINDVETPVSELFDADTIQIGEAKLRFNRYGYERPQEDL